jgi:hypothetical protein
MGNEASQPERYNNETLNQINNVLNTNTEMYQPNQVGSFNWSAGSRFISKSQRGVTGTLRDRVTNAGGVKEELWNVVLDNGRQTVWAVSDMINTADEERRKLEAERRKIEAEAKAREAEEKRKLVAERAREESERRKRETEEKARESEERRKEAADRAREIALEKERLRKELAEKEAERRREAAEKAREESERRKRETEEKARESEERRKEAAERARLEALEKERERKEAAEKEAIRRKEEAEKEAERRREEAEKAKLIALEKERQRIELQKKQIEDDIRKNGLLIENFETQIKNTSQTLPDRPDNERLGLINKLKEYETEKMKHVSILNNLKQKLLAIK